eukprot:140764_1
MRLCQKLGPKHVSLSYYATSLNSSRLCIHCSYVSERLFCSRQGPKQNGNNKETTEPTKQEQSSLSNFFKNLFPLDIIESNKATKNKWIQLWNDIYETNYFELDCDANNIEHEAYYKKFNILIASPKQPLRYEEFMCGAYEAMNAILKCLQQNDRDGIKLFITSDLLEQFDDMKTLMLDEKYNCIGKIMTHLKDFENAPNYSDMSINAEYYVTYYYQLKLNNNNNEQDVCIQKRVDVVWNSVWMASDEYKFVCVDDCVASSVECTNIPRSEK